MKKINTKFIAGMLAMALVFGMIGCDTGTTTKTEYVNTGGGGGGGQVPVYPENAAKIARDFDELKALVQPGKTGTVYIVDDDVTVDEDLLIPDGVKVVIATEDYAIKNPSAGILAAVGNTGLSGGYGQLIVKNGAVLTVQSGGAVVVGNTSDTSKTGVLKIQAGGKFHVPSGATLAVTVGSHVIVDMGGDPSTGLVIDDGAKLAIVGNLGDRDVIGAVGEDADVSDDVIVVEGTAPAAIGNVKVYTSVENAVAGALPITDPENPVVSSVNEGKDEVIANSPSQTTSNADDAKELIETTASVTAVTYSGPTALGEIEVPMGKTLIISGAVTGQTGIISGAGTLEITGALTTSAAHTVENVINSGTITLSTGGGFTSTVTNDGLITTADGDALAAILTVATGKIEATGASLSLSSGTTTVNANTELTVVSGATLAVASGATLAVASGAKLTVAETATIVVANNGTLDLTALYVVDVTGPAAGTPDGVATIRGTIEVASGGTYKSPAPSLAEEVVYEGTGKLKLNAGSTAYIGDIPYIGANGAIAALTWTDANPTGGYVLIDDDGMTLGGNGKLSHLAYESPTYDALNSFQIAGKVTIDAGSVLTIGPTTGVTPDASVKVDSDDELVLNGTVELYTTGYLTVKNGGKLTVGNTGTIKHTGDSGNVKVSVHNGNWEPKKADVTENPTGDWTVALAASDGDAVDITLGTVKISFTDTAIDVELENAEPAAAGKLTAGENTQIMFLGVAAE